MSFNIMNNIDYKVGIYIRLSKEDEEKEKYSESESIQNQRTLLMQYIKQNKLIKFNKNINGSKYF